MSRAAALVAALALLLAGCGDEGGDDRPARGGPVLTIVLDRDGDGGAPSERAQVSCPGDRVGVCELVEALPAGAGDPVPADVACTEIFGGPDHALVDGVVDGRPIDAELTRANGCEIERFDRFTPLLRELFPGYEPGASVAP